MLCLPPGRPARRRRANRTASPLPSGPGVSRTPSQLISIYSKSTAACREFPCTVYVFRNKSHFLHSFFTTGRFSTFQPIVLIPHELRCLFQDPDISLTVWWTAKTDGHSMLDSMCFQLVSVANKWQRQKQKSGIVLLMRSEEFTTLKLVNSFSNT